MQIEDNYTTATLQPLQAISSPVAADKGQGWVAGLGGEYRAWFSGECLWGPQETRGANKRLSGGKEDTTKGVWSRRRHPDNSSANPLALPAKQLNLENLRQGKLPHATIISITLQ